MPKDKQRLHNINAPCIVTGSAQELLEKCNPLGMFDSIATLAVASSMRELYRLVLVDTPLAPYFSESLSAGAPRRCGLLVHVGAQSPQTAAAESGGVPAVEVCLAYQPGCTEESAGRPLHHMVDWHSER